MKLYVGNLPYSVTEDNLRSMFQKYGEITEIILISDKYSGRSKGFGFVEMSDDSEANKAMEALDNYPLEDRIIRVNKAKPKEERPKKPYSRDSRSKDNRSKRPRSRDSRPKRDSKY